MSAQVPPEPTLADHGVTMEMLRKGAGGDEGALAEIAEWGRRRERRLPALRRFVALLARHGMVDRDMHRMDRDFVVAQCFAIATLHGLDVMDYEYRDAQRGPLASLMSIDLHAVEITGEDPGRLFPSGEAERAFLESVAGKNHSELGHMARDAIIEERDRVILF